MIQSIHQLANLFINFNISNTATSSGSTVLIEFPKSISNKRYTTLVNVLKIKATKIGHLEKIWLTMKDYILKGESVLDHLDALCIFFRGDSNGWTYQTWYNIPYACILELSALLPAQFHKKDKYNVPYILNKFFFSTAMTWATRYLYSCIRQAVSITWILDGVSA